MTYLLPIYKTKLKSFPTKKCTFKVWDDNSCETLRGCFECTDWDIFYNSTSSLDELNDVISNYILFCEQLCVSTKTVKCFPNNKPWVTKDVKEIINEKKLLFIKKDKDKLKQCQKKLDNALQKGRDTYRDKINSSFQYNNSKDVWDKLKQIIGTKETQTDMHIENPSIYVNDLNNFYSRFDEGSNQSEIDLFRLTHFNSFSDDPPFISETDTLKTFRSLKVNKAHGPDKMTPRIIKTCADQLSSPFTVIFNQALQQHKSPTIWKTSEIVPVPKKPKIAQIR